MSRRDQGSAVVEVVLLGVPLLVPLVLLAVAVTTAQQARAGVVEAARQAGRAYVTGTGDTAGARAADTARRVLADRGLPAEIRYAAAGSGCGTGTTRPPAPRPGVVLAVCVTTRVGVFGVERSVTGRFVVRADEHRDYR